MASTTLPTVLGPALLSALERKGYTTLTAVQTAILDPVLAGRDLRITSQTGSGKTVAVGFALREFVVENAPGNGKAGALARPRALIIAPTRELAKQVEEELSWLFSPLGAGVISVTGGAGYAGERRALSRKPAVIAATPGRLLEHLQRGSIDATAVSAVVLDEADRLLDLGFREDLEAILEFAPEGHRTHLVSATFPREVRALADATQKDPVHVEGTRLGAANADIDHVVHLIEGRQRIDALVNLLLANPDGQTLVFARTRADVAAITRELKGCGFAAMSLSGEMDQTARNRALADFKSGNLRVLVATDVAARGIDVQDIARVVHAEPPLDADSYTHRSGRTGRAGRKGTSSILASLPELARTTFLLRRAGVAYRFEAIPSGDAIRAAANARTAAALTNEDDDTGGYSDLTWALAKQIAGQGNVARAIARLLVKTKYAGPTEPRNVRAIDPPTGRAHPGPDRFNGGTRGGPSRARKHDKDVARVERNGSWVPFRVSWGQEQGADARRLLAVACRRGQIRGTDVGSIRVGRSHSVIEVASHVAEAFAIAAGGPDPRDPRTTFKPERAASHT
jgi:ATP-dependent RNA helicase DeaD